MMGFAMKETVGISEREVIVHRATVLLIVVLLFMTRTSRADRPNIVLFFIDDLGWKDVGCYGNDFIETPRIDRLGKQGIQFTNFYAAGNVCSATRCSVQSGRPMVEFKNWEASSE